MEENNEKANPADDLLKLPTLKLPRGSGLVALGVLIGGAAFLDWMILSASCPSADSGGTLGTTSCFWSYPLHKMFEVCGYVIGGGVTLFGVFRLVDSRRKSAKGGK